MHIILLVNYYVTAVSVIHFLMVKKQRYSALEPTPCLNIYLDATPLNATPSILTILKLKIFKFYGVVNAFLFIELCLF